MTTKRQELRKVLGGYDRRSVLTLLGALQLVPENAHLSGPLEAMAQMATVLPESTGRPELDPSTLGILWNRYREELPPDRQPDGPFIEPLTFFGGSFTVLTGGVRCRAFVPGLLAAGSFHHSQSVMDGETKQEALKLVNTALHISDTVAKRADLVRYMASIGKVGDPLFIPDVERLQQLQEALTLPRSSFEVSLESEEESGELGALIAWSESHSGRPIVISGSYLIVTQPALLASAAWHAVLVRAQEQGEGPKLFELYHDAVRRTVWGALKRFLMFDEEPPISQPPLRSCTEMFFRFDTDKLLYTVVLTQPFGRRKPDQVFAEWSPFGDVGRLRARIRQVVRRVRKRSPDIHEVLSLIVFQDCLGSGEVTWSYGDPDMPPVILLQAEDLVTLADLVEGDPLALWKFAVVSNRIKSARPIHMDGMLDEYALYRKCRYGPYLPSDRGEVGVRLPPEGTHDLRMEAVRKWDRHGAPAWDAGAFIEVERVSTEMEIPIYRPVGLVDFGTRLVTGLPVPVWIFGAPVDRINEYTWLGIAYANALSYWFWQLTPYLTSVVSNIPRPLVLRVELVMGPGWFESTLDHVSPDGLAAVRISAHPGDTSLTIRMEPGVSSLFRMADNTGEREWLRAVLTGIRDLCQPEKRHLLSDEAVDRILVAVAPVGLKRQMHNFSLHNVPTLDERDLMPFYRGVQDADLMTLEHQVGRLVTKDLDHRPGPVPPMEQEGVASAVLSFLFAELQRAIVGAEGDELLDNLMRSYETLVQRRTSRSQFLPSHIACYGPDPRIVNLVEEERVSFWNTAAALRFLIEYVAAQPPRGTTPLTMSLYDRLLALASMITQKGSEFDLVRNRLVDLEMEIAPFGLLSVNSQNYTRAMNRYLGVRLRELIDGSADLENPWRSEPTAEQYRAAEDHNVVLMGQPLTDLVKLLSHVGGIGDDGLDHGVARLPLEELVGLLCTRLGWSEERVRPVLAFALLEPRPDFHRPADPYRPHDVWPWRHNRRLSYLRRPLIALETSSGTDVLWGGRHLWEAQHYLWERFRTDRLKDIGPETTQRATNRRLSEGAEFNRNVAQLLSKDTMFEVHSNVLKVKKNSLSNVGDLDVVAVDELTHRIWVIECKNLASAGTPYDVASDLKEIFGEPGSKSHVQKFMRRLAWLEEHWDDLIDHLRLDREVHWELRPLLVLSVELLAPHLWPSPPVPVITFQQLEENCRRTDRRLDVGYDEPV